MKAFKAEKGMNFETMYYHFFYLFINEQFSECLKQIRMNKWWYDRMDEPQKKQIYKLANEIKGGIYK